MRLLAAAAILLVSGLGAGARPGAAASAPSPFVEARGGPFMTDGYGRVLQFHGFDVVPKCPSFSKVVASTPGQPCVPDVNHPGVPSYWLSPDPAYLAVDAERTFTDSDASALAALGFNFARVGLIWRALEPGRMATPAANDPAFCTPRALGTAPLKAADDQLDLTTVNAYLAHVDATVSLLAAHGIYSLIDMHQDDYSEFFNNPASATPWEGEGAPLWAVCTFLTGTTTPAPSNAANAAKWSQDPVIDPALAMAADHFWSNDVSGNLQGQYIRMWQEVAKHYRDNQWVIGYDPFNEPYDSTATVTPTEFDSRLQCFYAGSNDPDSRCSATVGADPVSTGFIPSILNASVDPNHLVTYEAPVTTDYHGGQTIGVGVPLNYTHLVFNFHVYPPVGAFTGGECSSAACPTNDDIVINNALQVQSATTTAQPGGPALLASEFGAEDYVPDLAYDANAMDGHNLTTGASSVPISWAYWAAFQNHDPTGQPNERLFTSARALTPKAAVLARAYPRATAGTPVAGAQSFDPATAVFSYAYAPDHAIAAPTEIVLPAIHYGGGYATQVSGASVTSACGAPLLTLAADPAATQVSVTVKPAPGCAAPVYVHTASSPCSEHNPCTTPNTGTAPPPVAALLLLGVALAGAARGARPLRAKLSSPPRRTR